MAEVRSDTNRSRSGYSIGQAARASGLTAKTIRYYEEIGLIPKARRRTGTFHTGGDRLYGDADIGRLRFIHHARLVDLSLTDIRELLKIADAGGCPSEHPMYGDVLKRHIRTIDQRINHLLGLRSMVYQLLKGSGSRVGESCTWDTCACMEPKSEGEQKGDSVSSYSGQCSDVTHKANMSRPCVNSVDVDLCV
jgi:MerR family transcriptional regulator, copper efflux regulator